MEDVKEKIESQVLENKLEEKEIENENEDIQNKEEKTIEKKQIEKIDKKIDNEKYSFKQAKIKNKKHIGTKIIIGLIIFVLFVAILSTGFALFNGNNTSILKGISIRNILVEGLTIEEATNLINDKLEYEKTAEIKLNINGEKYSITPEQIEVKYNVEEAINEAYDIGRNGNIIQNNFAIINTFINKSNVTLEITYNEKMLDDIIKDFGAKIPGAMKDNTYSVEDNELIITRGTDGIAINLENAKKAIIESIKEGKTEEIIIDTNNVECPDIDIEKIYEEVHSEPQNATYKTNPFEIIPHKNGIDFDKEAAKELLKEEKNEYIIKLTLTEPEIHTNEIGEEAFPDLLGAYSTKFDVTNVPRSKNVRLALEKLNGVVVMPGEVFSYNKTLGKRTVAAGFDYAAGYAGGKVVPMLGGGICQVSSTLYDAVVYANLKIVERYNHMFQTQYIGAGRDATVVYGSLDFRFENTRNYPIMIKTKSNGGLADIKIFGIKEEVEYEIEIVPTVLSYSNYSVVYENDPTMAVGTEKVTQSGMRGCKTITYKITKLNGQEISKEVLSTDTYSPMNKIVKRGTKGINNQTEKTPTVEQQTPEQPVVPEPETSTPTLPETEISKPVTPEPETPEKIEIPETPIVEDKEESVTTPEQPQETET